MKADKSHLRGRLKALNPEQRRNLAETLKQRGAPAAPRITSSLLSFSQQRMWHLHYKDPTSPSYNNPIVVMLSGPLNKAALQRSIELILQRHEILQAFFIEEQGQPAIKFDDAQKFELPQIDLTHLYHDEALALATRLVAGAARRPFQLNKAPLVRGLLVQLTETNHILSICFHHIVSDGWSLGILLEELALLYRAFTEGAHNPLPPLPFRYGDYVAWQQSEHQCLERQQHLKYWQRNLAGRLVKLSLPADLPPLSSRSYRGGFQSLKLSTALSEQLRARAMRDGVTLYVLLLTALNSLLHVITGESDIRIGSPSAGRAGPPVQNLMGCFLNTLVLRTDMSGNPDLSGLIQRVKLTVMEGLSHENVPFEQMVEAVKAPRDGTDSPLFQVMLVMNNAPVDVHTLGDLTVQRLEIYNGAAKFDWTFSLADTHAGISGVFNYDLDRFTEDRARLICDDFITTLTMLAQHPEMRLSEIPVRLRSSPAMKSTAAAVAPTARQRDKHKLRISASDLVYARLFDPPYTFPLLLQPKLAWVALAEWVEDHTEQLDELLACHGAILLRGFRASSSEEIERLSASLGTFVHVDTNYEPGSGRLLQFCRLSTPSYAGINLLSRRDLLQLYTSNRREASESDKACHLSSEDEQSFLSVRVGWQPGDVLLTDTEQVLMQASTPDAPVQLVCYRDP
jgi:alpha-ketoglutarate-dependent taurine dioxygenase